MSKKLNKREKLGLDILRDLYLITKAFESGADPKGEQINILMQNLPNKIKNLAEKS